MDINTLKNDSFINKQKQPRKAGIKKLYLTLLPILTYIFYYPAITTNYSHLLYIFLNPNKTYNTEGKKNRKIFLQRTPHHQLNYKVPKCIGDQHTVLT